METGKDWDRLRDLVLALRAHAKINRAELATRMGVQEKTVMRLENSQSVAASTVASIDLAFELPIGTARRVLEDGWTPTVKQAIAGFQIEDEPEDQHIAAMSDEELLEMARDLDRITQRLVDALTTRREQRKDLTQRAG